MKNFFKKIIVFLGIITAVSATSSFVSTTPTYAAGDRSFLGMPAWDADVNLSGDKDENQLIADIAQIATNILSDITVLASYLVIGYVIYGGYLYMFSAGDPAKAAAGKKTLTHTFIGLAIAMSATVILGAIRAALTGSKSLGDCNPLTMGECVSSGDIVVNLINWVIGTSGIVAVIFIIVGAWGYITSSGDPSKLQKAKNTILYAIIGLVIAALSLTLTAFISGIIRDANQNTDNSALEQNTNQEEDQQ